MNKKSIELICEIAILVATVIPAIFRAITDEEVK